ncbi:VOC family protein [Hyphomicrobiales bacterium]|nr:VOC family protein [Hyphomicrobiales bacterium]CAH1692074.1 VOC family protein [Hyphomicrobiales bacterium]
MPGQVFSEVSQLGYITRDIHTSMRNLRDTLGVGPWFYLENRMPITYRSQRHEIDTIVAFANIGPMQLELIQQCDDRPSMYLDYLADSRVPLHGLQHFAFWVENHDGAVADALQRGFIELQSTTVARGRVVYLSHPKSPDFVVEFAESTPGRQAMRQRVREAASGWDGGDPFRALER